MNPFRRIIDYFGNRYGNDNTAWLEREEQARRKEIVLRSEQAILATPRLVKWIITSLVNPQKTPEQMDKYFDNVYNELGNKRPLVMEWLSDEDTCRELVYSKNFQKGLGNMAPGHSLKREQYLPQLRFGVARYALECQEKNPNDREKSN